MTEPHLPDDFQAFRLAASELAGLQRDVLALIQAFEDRTGLHVEGVGVEGVETYDGRRRTVGVEIPVAA